MPAPTPLPELVPVSLAARELGVAPCRVRDLVGEGRLRGVLPTPRRMFIPRADVVALKAERAARRAAAAKAAADGLTAAEVAAACNVSVYTVRRWISLGVLPAAKVPVADGFLRFRIARRDVEAILAAGSAE